MANQPPTIALKDRLSALLLELLISIFSELSCRDIGRLRTTSRSIRTIIDTYIATIVRSRILFHQSRLWSNYETLSRNGSLLPSEVFERFLCYYGEMGGYTTDIRRDALVRLFERYVHTRHDDTEDQVPTSRCELVAQACADAAIWVLEVAASRRQEIGPWTSDFLAESKKLYFWIQRVNADGRLRRCSILLKDGVFGPAVHKMEDMLATTTPRRWLPPHGLIFPFATAREAQLSSSRSLVPTLEPLETSLNIPFASSTVSYRAESLNIASPVLKASVSRLTVLEKAAILEQTYVWRD